MSVFLAVKDAITSARAETGIEGNFQLNSGLTTGQLDFYIYIRLILNARCKSRSLERFSRGPFRFNSFCCSIYSEIECSSKYYFIPLELDAAERVSPLKNEKK